VSGSSALSHFDAFMDKDAAVQTEFVLTGKPSYMQRCA